MFPFVTCFLAGFLFCPRTKWADASSWKHEAVISIGPQKALRGEEQEFGGISVEQGKSRACRMSQVAQGLAGPEGRTAHAEWGGPIILQGFRPDRCSLQQGIR